MGIFFKKAVYIPTYDNEQDYGIVVVSITLNIVFCRIEIQFNRSVFHSNIRINSRNELYCCKLQKQKNHSSLNTTVAFIYFLGV